MEFIDRDSRAPVLFTLTWHSEAASHQEQLWADPVYMVWGRKGTGAH